MLCGLFLLVGCYSPVTVTAGLFEVPEDSIQNVLHVYDGDGPYNRRQPGQFFRKALQYELDQWAGKRVRTVPNRWGIKVERTKKGVRFIHNQSLAAVPPGTLILYSSANIRGRSESPLARYQLAAVRQGQLLIHQRYFFSLKPSRQASLQKTLRINVRKKFLKKFLGEL